MTWDSAYLTKYQTLQDNKITAVTLNSIIIFISNSERDTIIE